jgi:hypothetical protein
LDASPDDNIPWRGIRFSIEISTESSKSVDPVVESIAFWRSSTVANSELGDDFFF